MPNINEMLLNLEGFQYATSLDSNILLERRDRKSVVQVVEVTT